MAVFLFCYFTSLVSISCIISPCAQYRQQSAITFIVYYFSTIPLYYLILMCYSMFASHQEQELLTLLRTAKEVLCRADLLTGPHQVPAT